MSAATERAAVRMVQQATALAEIADLLDTAPEYRVLRQFQPRETYGDVAAPVQGLFVDVEATGLNADEDRIIQFAAVHFEFDWQGHVGRILGTMNALEDPGAPLDPEVVEVTGLTDAQLKGQRVDDADVALMLHGVQLVVAHNADYDRRMIERRFRGFDTLPWACSQRDVEWNRFGCQYIGLEYLLMKSCREFFLPHDALDDCRVGLHILATPRTDAGDWPMRQLVESARTPAVRIWAWQSPFATKDKLRLRRFRWDADARCWRKDVRASDVEKEIAWLTEHVYAGDPDFAQAIDTTEVHAVDRYSRRA